MGVTKDNHVRSLPLDPFAQRIVQRSRLNDVMKQEAPATELNKLGQAVAKARIIRVPRDGGDGCNLFQLHEDFRESDISTVQNVLNAVKGPPDLWVEEIMSVGDDPDSHSV